MLLIVSLVALVLAVVSAFRHQPLTAIPMGALAAVGLVAVGFKEEPESQGE